MTMGKVAHKFFGESTDWLSFSLGLGMMAVSLSLAFSSSLKYQVRNWLALNERVVLSTLTGNITNDGMLSKIIKVRADNQLFIEVYQVGEDGQELISKLALPDSQDAYFHLRGESANLLLNDVDGDSVAEIVAPSYDANFVAHLNIFKYDPQSKSFYLWNPQE